MQRTNRRLTAIVTMLALVLLAVAGPTVAETADALRAKYVFLFIGDGMGEAQREIGRRLMVAQAQAEGKTLTEAKLRMDRLPVRGLMTTHSANSKVTDSAAAGTALACGVTTNNGMIGMTPDGRAVRTIGEIIRDAGFHVGILSSVSIDHATPASFYAHQKSRNSYADIILQLPASDFQYFGGGGARGWSETKDKLARQAWQAGYRRFDVTGELLASLPPAQKIWAQAEELHAGAAMPYDLDRRATQPTLAGFTQSAIQRLDGENGFFIMVEGGKIDWACHANDIATCATDVLALDAAIGQAMDFYAKHPDETLIIVTADHETGGLKLKDKADATALLGQTVSADVFAAQVARLRDEKANFADALLVVGKYMGLTDLSEDERRQLSDAFDASVAAGKRDKGLYGSYDPLTITCTKIIAARADAEWGSFGHTAQAVPLTAIGAAAETFKGDLDNVDVPARILKAMGIDTQL
ncbi:MAG: alkaline phosphatase, partial [Phycisphaerae bacterium]|nr:alkaline phosphatase [Phycisphaerae bacterium]